jgi:hypothetical protein
MEIIDKKAMSVTIEMRHNFSVLYEVHRVIAMFQFNFTFSIMPEYEEEC